VLDASKLSTSTRHLKAHHVFPDEPVDILVAPSESRHIIFRQKRLRETPAGKKSVQMAGVRGHFQLAD
jgi:hypothetical protein